ncbi:bifunctional metallophosphatase/5'-nucleotidase [Selenomonas ruminantium]|uniref:2',3'-cyclic-nucleotide 2'-phosphodiesterase/5'-or 3'-nucleotidase, 5'-nucleotidase family n=1 Tax=Selenomonas ruminantium TaxID=971 RepID=A0A1H0RW60_SELRU|nr:bifunctional UDP-sugar hydrolase/5'-nucleotidase [Selenomonas ruminantium]SDP33246.1 2',3'-cyclic-nucleotide 2'-phosphodiesterase/5'-or 3'-nucleotidase, 5'-nucleotidase family [Selenomonas ruminantium]
MWQKKLTALALGIMLALPVSAGASVQKDGVHITILHTNDIHARVEENAEQKILGMGWIAGGIRAQKAADEDTLALDGGDTFHGLPIINLSKGANMAMLLNLSGYDAMTPGNHDFNYGERRLLELAKMLNFPILSANTYDKTQKDYLFRPYKSFTFNGVKVAVIGLTTPEVAFKTNPANVTEVFFANPITEAKTMMAKLRKSHDVVIGLMHMGVDKSSEFTSERIAREVPGFDIIIDGHSHTILNKGLRVGRTLICQTGCYDNELGKVELVVKGHKVRKAEASLLDKQAVEKLAGQPDAGVQQALAEMKESTTQELKKVVASSPRELTSAREIVRTQESELGNLTADALRAATGADAALANGGSLRADLPQGKITRGTILSIFPFGNTVQKVELKGEVIKAALEHSVEYVPAAFGGFMNVSGMTFDLDKKAPGGQRISNVKINGQPLDLQKKYTVAMNDFTAAGGDGYTMLKGARMLGVYGAMEDIVVEYIRTHGVQDIAVGRIHVK